MKVAPRLLALLLVRALQLRQVAGSRRALRLQLLQCSKARKKDNRHSQKYCLLHKVEAKQKRTVLLASFIFSSALACTSSFMARTFSLLRRQQQ